MSEEDFNLVTKANNAALLRVYNLGKEEGDKAGFKKGMQEPRWWTYILGIVIGIAVGWGGSALVIGLMCQP